MSPGGGVDVEATYRELAPAVLGYLRGHGAPDPENVLGEVFLAVARQADGFTGDGAALRRWVFTIAHHRLVDAHRRHRFRRHRDLEVVPESALATPAPDPRDPGLVAALATLTPEQRATVLLRYEADLSIADVGEILGRSPEAVKKLQQRGLAALRRALA